MRYRMEVRITSADVGRRVVIRWRRPRPPANAPEPVGDEVADVLGILEAADDAAFTVRKTSGERVVIPRDRALGAKTIPPPPAARRPSAP